MKSLNTLIILFATTLLSAQTVADFENFNLSPGTFIKNAGDAHAFESGHVSLPNFYDDTFQSWSGWAISSMTDVTTPGYLNDVSAITGGGVNGSTTYAVAYVYGSEAMNLTAPATGGVVQGLYVTNSTYAYLSMLEGDGFAKRFGGEDGNDPDFFKITIRKHLNGQVGTDSVEFYLADYRFADNNQDYIVQDWQYVDLTPLGNADKLEFTLASSDVGDFGINTPTYFCVDNVTTSDMPSASETAIPSIQIKAWPNPVQHSLHVTLDGNQAAKAFLSDIYGKKLLEKSLAPGLNQLDVSRLAAGLFTLRIAIGDQMHSQIFVKN